MTPETEPARWRWHAGAAAVYLILALVFLDHGESLLRNLPLAGTDPDIFVWCLKWWPWSIAHDLDPFTTRLVWQPLGVSIVWITSVPLLAAVMLPVTLVWGPVLSYNLLIIAAPVLSSWCAYRLCLYLTAAPLAAILGGFLFGFSAYETRLAYATPNLSFTCVIPLLLWLGLARCTGQMGRRRTVLLGSLLLIAQFLICIEVFAAMFLFSVLAWGLGFVLLPERRRGLLALLGDAILAAPLVIIGLAPVLFEMLRHWGFVRLPWYWAWRCGTDALYVVGAAPFGLFLPWLDRLTGGDFGRPLPGQTPAFNVFLLFIIVAFVYEFRQRAPARLLIYLLLLMVICCLGPRLMVDGHDTGINLPWRIATQFGVLGELLPNRFLLFISLAAAMLSAMWMGARRGGQKVFRLLLGLAAVLSLLPNLKPMGPVPDARFFAPGRVEAVLGPGARVLVLPFAINGYSSYWQAENDFGFAQTGGYLGPPPAAFINDPAVVQMFDNVFDAEFEAAFARFCAKTNTQFVVAGPGTPASLMQRLQTLDWNRKTVDDVTVFTVPGRPPAGAVNG